jgi:hypothetical protein
LWETIHEKRQASLDIVDAFARALGVSPAYLLDLSDDPTPPGVAPILPIPAIEIAELVRRLNAMQPEVRVKVAAGISPLLDMIAPWPTGPAIEVLRLQVGALSPSEQQALYTLLGEMLEDERRRATGGLAGAKLPPDDQEIAEQSA